MCIPPFLEMINTVFILHKTTHQCKGASIVRKSSVMYDSMCTGCMKVKLFMHPPLYSVPYMRAQIVATTAEHGKIYVATQ